MKRGRFTGDIEIKSISDTIAIFTYCKEEESTEVITAHGELCQWIIPKSIKEEIPVRGATAFGLFDISENIFVGKAIDEAASWHAQSDWIGVHLTPSAEYIYKDLKKGIWYQYSLPNKIRLNWKPHCVNWTLGWKERANEIDKIKESFRNLGPIIPEIAGKFINTLTFIEKIKRANRQTI